jgi:hypothetical protein
MEGRRVSSKVPTTVCAGLTVTEEVYDVNYLAEETHMCVRTHDKRNGETRYQSFVRASGVWFMCMEDDNILPCSPDEQRTANDYLMKHIAHQLKQVDGP